jgi:sugar/nucleoside kinase (ribokinase family)
VTRVVFAGLSTLDLAYLVDEFPQEDSKNLAREQFTAGGGPALNASVACAALGTEAVLITALGRSAMADLIRVDVETHGVEIVDTTPRSHGQPPISSIVVASSTASRTVVSVDGSQTSAPFTEDLAHHLDNAAALLVDGHHPDVAIGMATAAQRRGVPVVLDAGRWKPVFERLLPLTDIAICAAGFQPPGTATIGDICALGPRVVAITHGGKSIEYATPDQRGSIAVDQVDAIDSLGAGDILHGAFCHFLASGRDDLGALGQAARVASKSTEFFGTRAWIDALNKR